MAEAAAAVAAVASGAAGGRGGGIDSGGARGDLPPAMMDGLKVSLSLLRRLANRNITTIGGPFSSVMPVWPLGHPQVRGTVDVQPFD